MTTSLGVNISCDAADLDPRFPLVSGQTCLAQAIARRLVTPRGALASDPDYGLDVRAWLNEAFTDAQVFALSASIEGEIEKDPRVLAATASLVWIATTGHLEITVAVDTADGPFDLVLDVSSVTVELLAGG